MIHSSLLSLLTLQTCHACERPLTVQESHLCFDCLGQIPFTSFERTPCDNELYYRLAGKVPLAGAAGMFYFDKAGKLQRLISQLKYKNALPLGAYLGELWGLRLEESGLLPPETVLLPVPLHWRKSFRRGYNQAEVIARGLKQTLGFPIDRRTLQRTRFTPSQTRLSGTARWQNVASAFRLRRQPPPYIALVDDVITTGATLEACIRTLYEAEVPPEAVYVISLGVARKH